MPPKNRFGDRFAPDGGGFSMLMPDSPISDVETISVTCAQTGKMVNMTTHSYTTVIEQDASVYAVFYYDLPKDCVIDLEMALKLISLFSKPGVMQHKQLLKLNGNPGMEFKMRGTVEGTSVLMWGRSFAVPQPNNQVRAYNIIVQSTKEQALQQTLASFFKSFKLTN